jgi:chromosome segregation ATPase
VLSLVLEATRLARDQAHDEEWVERWNSTLLSKLLRIWLPAAGEQVARSVADAQQADELHRAAALRLREEVRHANARCDDVLKDSRAAVEVEKRALADELSYAREMLDAERQCSQIQRQRLIELESRLAALTVLAPPVDSLAVVADGGRACDGCEEREMRCTSAERQLEETRSNLEADLAAAHDREARTLAQLERHRDNEAQAGREFASRIESMRADDAAAVDKIRAAAQLATVALEEECECLRSDGQKLREEVAALKIATSALEARCEEAAVGFARELARQKESEERAQLTVAELQERVLAAHRETLDDTRARDARLRKDTEARSTELLELHGKLTSALVEAEQTRSDSHRLKRRLQEVQDQETEVKRLRRLDEDKATRLLRCEMELREARSRREEVTREREELRAQVMDLERALAVATRELQMERARIQGP